VAREEEIVGRPFHQSPWAQSLLHAGGPMELIDELLDPRLAADSHQQWMSRVDDAYARAIGRDPVERAEYALTAARLGRIDTVGTALLRRDVLIRNPATDQIMIDWHQSVPPALRAGRRIYVEALRRCFPRHARVQRSNSSALPITAGRWLREYHWQRERLWRWWIGYRYPITRKWGTDGHATQAWTFDTWRRSGTMNALLEPDARVLEWVRRDKLMALWDVATADPVKGPPVMALATLETIVRYLQELAVRPATPSSLGEFEHIDASAPDAANHPPVFAPANVR